MIELIASIAIAATAPSPSAPVVPAFRIEQRANLAGDHYPKKFVEQVQGVQYDGDYSPPVGRPAEPEASPTTPVRYVPPYMRQIPVIVRPAPVYVDEAQVQQQAQQQAQQAQQARVQQSYQAPGQGAASDASVLTSAPIVPSAPLPSAGSPTGSTAIATYGTLPQARAVDAADAADDGDG